MTTNTMTQSLPVRLASDVLARIAPRLIVSAAMLMFFTLWMTDLGFPTLSGDESFIAQLSSQPAQEILYRLNFDEPHPPVYYMLMHGWHLLAGNRPEFVVRFPSVMIGLLLLSLTYRIGRELGLRWPLALAAMVWLGLNPQVAVHVREARMYDPMIATLAFVVLIALRFERLPQRWAIAIAAAASLLALMTHYFNLLFVGAVGLWGVFAFKGATRRSWIIAQGIAIGLLALWLPLFGTGFFNPTSLSEGKTWSFVLPPWETWARVAQVGLLGYRDYYPIDNEQWMVVIGDVLLAGALVLGSVQGQGRKRWLLLIGALLPLTVYALLGWFKPLYHAKYMLPWLLFVALALGRLLAYRRVLGVLAAAGLLAIMLPPTIRTLQKPYDPAITISRSTWLTPFSREFTRYLVERSGPSDVFAQGTPDAANCYYADFFYDRHLGCELIPQNPGETLPQLEQRLDQLLAQHAVLWFMDFYNPAWDPNAIADTAFASTALSLGNEEIRGGRLRLYTSPERVLREYHPVGVRIGEMAELEGIWVTQAKDVHVVLVWRSLVDHATQGAKVFVHLLDSAGQQIAQNDGIPVWWTRPFETWTLDERLLDVYTLTLPEDAQVSDWMLRVGLYDPNTTQRFSAVDASGQQLPDDAALISQADLTQR